MYSVANIAKILKIVCNTSMLDTLIFFVTSRCNFRCKTCFYWESLNRSDDLELSEIERLSRSMNPFNVLLVSGGEPFLRKDLSDIVASFHANNNVKTVSLPTNAYLTGDIIEQTSRLLRAAPALEVIVRLSLDGLNKTHDIIRGQSGSFDALIRTHEALRRLTGVHDRLKIGVNTIICRDNVHQLGDIMGFVADEMGIDDHAIEIIRGDPLQAGTSTEIGGRADTVYGEITSALRGRASEKGKSLRERFRDLLSASCYSVQRDNYLRRKDWPFPCFAGRTILTVYPNGDVAPCELLPAVANLRDHHYNIAEIRSTPGWSDALRKISRGKCFCTHRCFIDASVSHHIRSILTTLCAAAYLHLRAGGR